MSKNSGNSKATGDANKTRPPTLPNKASQPQYEEDTDTDDENNSSTFTDRQGS